MFAENNFFDYNLDEAGSSEVELIGTMSAGNHISINRDFVDAVNAALERYQTAQKCHVSQRISDQVIFRRHRIVGLEHSSRRFALNVVNDQCGRLAPEARIGDDDSLTVRADLQVLKIRTGRRDFRPEVVVVRDVACRKIEREESGVVKAMVAVIDRPEDIALVDHNTKNRIEQL